MEASDSSKLYNDYLAVYSTTKVVTVNNSKDS